MRAVKFYGADDGDWGECWFDFWRVWVAVEMGELFDDLADVVCDLGVEVGFWVVHGCGGGWFYVVSSSSSCSH